jgi:heparosan-N-sulfate-glucuronate 5-epimerase
VAVISKADARRRGGVARVRDVSRFLSTSFDEPVGPHIDRDGVRGYYIDLRVKARKPDFAEAWPWEPNGAPWVACAQMGLGGYERYLAGEGHEWLELARRAGERIAAHLAPEGPRRGALEHNFDFPHTFPMRTPWISAMAQGEACSLLVRLHRDTGEQGYATAALLALEPLFVRTPDGGAMDLLDGLPFPEEYPTEPPSFVLNGGIFSLWGLYDAGRGLGDERAARAFDAGLDALVANLHRWDTGWWSRYDLYPHPVRNVASSGYHELHVNQLRAMAVIAPRPELAETADRWERYRASRLCRARAFVSKVLFRLRVPRSRPVKAA